MFGLMTNFFRSIVSDIIEEDYADIFLPQAVLSVKRLFDDVQLPTKGSKYSAGFDLRAYSYALIENKMVGETVKSVVGETVKLNDDTFSIPPGTRCLIKTGLQCAVPKGCYGRIAPRSGLAVKNGIGIGAGVIDEDYRGELGIVLFNHDMEESLDVKKGDRIAQIICECIVYPKLEVVDTLPEIDDDDEEPGRGAEGFGSTGIH